MTRSCFPFVVLSPSSVIQASPTSVSADTWCSYCGGSGASKKCSRCKIPYCNRECQASDWPEHKFNCKVVSITEDNKKSETKSNPRTDNFNGIEEVPAQRMRFYLSDLPIRQSIGKTFHMLHAFLDEGLVITGTVVCQKQAEQSQALATIETEFHNTCNRQGNIVIEDLKSTLLVIAQLDEHNWARASVCELPPTLKKNSEIDVYFIDHGIRKTVAVESLTYLTRFASYLPPQAGRFPLKDLENIISCDTAMVRKLNDILAESPVEVRLDNEDLDEAFASVTVPSLKLSLNKYILQNCLGATQQEATSSSAPISSASATTRPTCSDAVRGMMMNDLPVKPFPDESTFMFIGTEVVSPELFYGQVADNATIQMLSNLFTNLQTTYSNPGPAFTPKVGELCVAKFKEDGCWYRACVTGYNADLSARVSYRYAIVISIYEALY